MAFDRDYGHYFRTVAAVIEEDERRRGQPGAPAPPAFSPRDSRGFGGEQRGEAQGPAPRQGALPEIPGARTSSTLLQQGGLSCLAQTPRGAPWGGGGGPSWDQESLPIVTPRLRGPPLRGLEALPNYIESPRGRGVGSLAQDGPTWGSSSRSFDPAAAQWNSTPRLPDVPRADPSGTPRWELPSPSGIDVSAIRASASGRGPPVPPHGRQAGPLSMAGGVTLQPLEHVAASPQLRAVAGTGRLEPGLPPRPRNDGGQTQPPNQSGDPAQPWGLMPNIGNSGLARQPWNMAPPVVSVRPSAGRTAVVTPPCATMPADSSSMCVGDLPIQKHCATIEEEDDCKGLGDSGPWQVCPGVGPPPAAKDAKIAPSSSLASLGSRAPEMVREAPMMQRYPSVTAIQEPTPSPKPGRKALPSCADALGALLDLPAMGSSRPCRQEFHKPAGSCDAAAPALLRQLGGRDDPAAAASTSAAVTCQLQKGAAGTWDAVASPPRPMPMYPPEMCLSYDAAPPFGAPRFHQAQHVPVGGGRLGGRA